MYKTSDEIRIRGLHIYASHGVFPEEKEDGQYFTLNITLGVSLVTAGLTDDLCETINYGEVCEFVAEEFTKCSYDLIEAACENIVRSLLIKYSSLESVEVEVCKPEAPVDEDFDNISVCIKRGWHTAYIAVGSNLGDSIDIIEHSKAMLSEIPGVKILKEATLITTKPYGVTEQPDFTNGLLKIRTLCEPFELLDKLNDIEARLGRTRQVHWGPRTIDLDIIYYDDIVIDTERLSIPHVDMANRTFVLEPLNEVDPYVRHPITGLRASEMLAKLKQ